MSDRVRRVNYCYPIVPNRTGQAAAAGSEMSACRLAGARGSLRRSWNEPPPAALSEHVPKAQAALAVTRTGCNYPRVRFPGRLVMRGKVLLALVLVGAITGAASACRRRGAAPPAMGKESTTVDTTKKK